MKIMEIGWKLLIAAGAFFLVALAHQIIKWRQVTAIERNNEKICIRTFGRRYINKMAGCCPKICRKRPSGRAHT